MSLNSLGWNSYWEQVSATYQGEGYTIGRVATEHKRMYRVYTGVAEVLAEVSGKFRFSAAGRGDYPAVGDWVVLKEHNGDRATIHALLSRRTKFSRKVAGLATEEQIVAANADTVFIVVALNHDFNVRRIERTLILAWESGANPVIILSKADLCGDIEQKCADVQSVAFGVPVHVISSLSLEGIEGLQAYLQPGQTVALLGSSGVGKSTLINLLMGDEVQRVNSVREGDDRGRHTTTHRELMLLPNGAVIIDTPGMRELQLWESEEGLQNTFEDIEELAKSCFYSDCSHRQEPGCAVLVALHTGQLSKERFKSYEKMQRELAHVAKKMSVTQRAHNKESGRKQAKYVRAQSKGR